MTVVKNMALDGTTICSTIHSPTPYTFGLFDKVLFILGGFVVFFGETSEQSSRSESQDAKPGIHTENALKFLNGFAHGMTNVYDNDADWLTMIIVRAERENRGPEIAEAFAQSSYMMEPVSRSYRYSFTDVCLGSRQFSGGQHEERLHNRCDPWPPVRHQRIHIDSFMVCIQDTH